MKVLSFLILILFSSSTFGQINLKESKFKNYLFSIPNDSTIELGSCPSIAKMEIKFKKNRYNSLTQKLHIKGKIFDEITKEPLPFVTIMICNIDVDSLNITPLNTYSIGNENEFNLKTRMKKGQFIVFRQTAFMPTILKLEN